MNIENKRQRGNRLPLLEEFKAAPDTAWFGQVTVAAVRDCSEATIERDRWAGNGVPFVKCGRSVRYRKADILEWLSKYRPIQSTTEAQQQEG
jgi:hypothetical protein